MSSKTRTDQPYKQEIAIAINKRQDAMIRKA